MFRYGINKLKSGTALKIAHQMNVQIIIRSIYDNFKIECHFFHRKPFNSGF